MGDGDGCPSVASFCAKILHATRRVRVKWFCTVIPAVSICTYSSTTKSRASWSSRLLSIPITYIIYCYTYTYFIMVLKRKRSDSEISCSSSLFSSPPAPSNFMVIDTFRCPQNTIATPALFSSRTRKRYRDNRPSEEDVHRKPPREVPHCNSALTIICRTHAISSVHRTAESERVYVFVFSCTYAGSTLTAWQPTINASIESSFILSHSRQYHTSLSIEFHQFHEYHSTYFVGEQSLFRSFELRGL